MDPITLKIGDNVISYPAEFDVQIDKDENKPRYPRRAIKEEGYEFQVCKENKSYHYANGISIRPRLAYKWKKRVKNEPRTPLRIFNGIKLGKPSHKKPITIYPTGYKEDISKCYTSDNVDHEGCELNRYLPDIDMHIWVYITTTELNIYGKPELKEKIYTRDVWPKLMDDLETFWRSFITNIDE